MRYFNVVLAVVMFGCSKQSVNNELNISNYTLNLPNNWEKVDLKSPDIYIYAITDKTDTIIVHNGVNLGEFTDLQDFEEIYDTLSSYIVQVVKPKANTTDMWGLYLGGRDVKDKLSIVARISNKKNIPIIKEVFSSLKIKTSCSNICNAEVIGEIIYKRECFNCHGDSNLGFGGVSLETLCKSKSTTWLSNWIRNESFRKSNKTNSYNRFEVIKDLDCTIPQIKPKEEESLILYLKNKN